MDIAKGVSPPRWLLLAVLAASLSVIAGCASTFPQWRPDRCHRAQAVRETLNWDFICLESP